MKKPSQTTLPIDFSGKISCSDFDPHCWGLFTQERPWGCMMKYSSKQGRKLINGRQTLSKPFQNQHLKMESHPTSHLQSKMEECMVEIEGEEGFRVHLGH